MNGPRNIKFIIINYTKTTLQYRCLGSQNLKFNFMLLKGTHHNTTLNTDYVEHLVLSDYNLPESNDSSQNNFSHIKMYSLKKEMPCKRHMFSIFNRMRH
jgi:hypothetical protein